MICDCLADAERATKPKITKNDVYNHIGEALQDHLPEDRSAEIGMGHNKPQPQRPACHVTGFRSDVAGNCRNNAVKRLILFLMGS